MEQAIQDLDGPRPLPRRALWFVVPALAAFVALTAWVVVNADRPGPIVRVTSTAHAVAMFAVTGFTALTLLGYAIHSGRRGFLILGGTYAYLCAVMAMWPFFSPNGILDANPPAPLIGGEQSSITLFWLWHWALLVGIVVAAVVFVRDRRDNRRCRRPARGMTIALVSAGVGAVLTFVAVSVGAPWLPALISGDQVTTADAWPSYAFVVAAGAGGLVVARAARNGSVITRWLLAVALVLLGEAVVVVNADRYSWGWYYNRAFGFLSLSVLLVVLVWTLGRMGRATEELAARDMLTQAMSRSAFLSELGQQLETSNRTGCRAALLWLDLDGFKAVNDALGHTIGDQILCLVVRRIRARVRAGDHIGRLGGDEFGLLLCGDVSDTRIDSVAQSTLAAVRDPIAVEHTTAMLTVSVGVAVAPTDAVDAERLLRQADLAMYAAKNAGGDRAQRFTDELESAELSRARLRQHLSAALHDGCFELAYQPIVDTTTGRIAGVESLVRWIRNGRRIPAGEFIGFAEQSGQVLAIGRCVIQVLERDLPRILARVPTDVFVSFNMSVKELADDELIDVLLRSDLMSCRARLLLEVTESVELGALTGAERNLVRIRDAGLRIAIDDFGIGYSNLIRLAQLHPTILKVDRGLVARAGASNLGGNAFLAAAHGVATSLDCDVVAEGVESQAESSAVVRLGIRYAQGFHHARPMPLDDMLDLFGEREHVIRL